MELTSMANKIINTMQSYIPKEWKKVCLCFEMDENSFIGDFFVFLKDNTLKRSVDLCKEKIVSDVEINEMYKEIYQHLKQVNDSYKYKGSFTRYNLSFDREKFEEHYDYNPITEGNFFFDYWLKWKSEYVHL